MVGLSGGIDSAYLAHVMRTRYGLRLLAVHVDGGWNSEPAVHNIENLVRALDLDLNTYVVEWEEMRDLQLAFLRSGVLNQDIPQDHAFFATLYGLAKEYDIGTFLSGINFATENVSQPNAGFPSIDGRHVRAIHARFGKLPLRSYPVLTIPRYLYQTRIRNTPKIVKPLDWMPYDKDAARSELQRHYYWNEYGTKHSESRFTKFYQDIYLPAKFGFDKRRLHLSSLIVSGQVTRQAAIEELMRPSITPHQETLELRYIAKKLQISTDELRSLIYAPLVPHSSYSNDRWILQGAHMLRDFWRNQTYNWLSS